MDFENLIKKQREFFSGNSRDVELRIEKLKLLDETIRKYEEKIFDALTKDFGKSNFETFISEMAVCFEEIKFIVKRLKKWSKPRKVKTSINNFRGKSYIYKEPYGVVLIISPWNYPFGLSFSPLIGAIAAGNCAIVKPSELTPETSKIIKEICDEVFDKNHVSAIEGGVEVSKKLLNIKFDYIFFTGSVNVGKIVMEACSKHLTPVTLELGGKSPCIVDSDTNLDISAKRIVWGKFLNCGQTCVAPDYLYVHKDIKDQFIEKLKQYIIEFYTENPKTSPDFARIINKSHFERLKSLLDGEKIIFGGDIDSNQNYISPTLLEVSNWDSPIMKDEIFGPLLPILTFEKIEKVVEIINSKTHPLALYLFSNSKTNQDYVLSHTQFGGGAINDTIMHLVGSYLPFGGVGSSGMGSYHGKASFDTFTHEKSILKKSFWPDLKLRYPPYKNKLKTIKKLLK
jgi:aldehyde dehydrogenase (NAD+)